MQAYLRAMAVHPLSLPSQMQSTSRQQLVYFRRMLVPLVVLYFPALLHSLRDLTVMVGRRCFRQGWERKTEVVPPMLAATRLAGCNTGSAPTPRHISCCYLATCFKVLQLGSGARKMRRTLDTAREVESTWRWSRAVRLGAKRPHDRRQNYCKRTDVLSLLPPWSVLQVADTFDWLTYISLYL